jgi:hypothetical protein
MNVIQGTILARRDVMSRYPDLGRGEDTLQTHALFRAEASNAFRVSRLRGIGWCYIYRYHGSNVWDAAHHRAISAVKHLATARLLPRLRLLQARLKDYSPQLPLVRTYLRNGTEYMTLGEPDLARSPGSDVQAAVFLRRTSSATRSGDDGPDSDVQIP